MIRFTALGSLELSGDDGRPLLSVLSQPRRLALLAYLALARPAGFHHRDTLTALFWPDADAEHARDALSQALRFLRRSLGDDAILGRGAEEVGISRELIWCDVTALEAALEAGREEEALALYRGELLAGFNVSDALEFERWLDGERARLRERVASAAIARAGEAARAGNPAGAATWARQGAALRPFDESLHRRVLEYLDAAGDRAGALQEHEVFRRRLQEELESEPAPETAALVQAIRRRAATTSPREGPATAAPAAISEMPAAPAPSPTTAHSVTPWPSRRKVLTALAALLVVGGAVGAGWLWRLPARRASHAPSRPTRIVVLPFQNLGPPEDQYFADGVTDELTTRLSGVRQLAVISRTSANQYRNTTKGLKQIGAELGVSYVLEGSVRWARTPGGKDEIRITPQLIRTSDDTHVWAGSYDRELHEIFAIQSEIARSVADALSVALGTRDRERLDERPTRSLTAYDYYLKALDRSESYAEADIRAALRLYEQAVQVDPRFVAALVGIAGESSLLVNLGYDLAGKPCQLADDALKRAKALAPDQPQVRLATAWFDLRCLRDRDRALAEADLVARALPAHAAPHVIRGLVARGRGNFDLSAAEYQRAFDLDPRSAIRAHELANSLYMAGRFELARLYEERAVSLDPSGRLNVRRLADIVLVLTHNLDSARAVLAASSRYAAPDNGNLQLAWIYYAELARDYEGALRRIPRRTLFGYPPAFIRAELYDLMGRAAEARRSFEESRPVLEEWRLKDPGESRAYAALGEVYAGLGRRQDALAAAARAVELMPISRSAMLGPDMVYLQARTLAMLGDKQAALDKLEVAVRYPWTVTPVQLRLEPWWDPLRAEPRFQKLAQGR